MRVASRSEYLQRRYQYQPPVMIEGAEHCEQPGHIQIHHALLALRACLKQVAQI